MFLQSMGEYGRVWAHAILSRNHEQLAIPDDTDKTDGDYLRRRDISVHRLGVFIITAIMMLTAVR